MKFATQLVTIYIHLLRTMKPMMHTFTEDWLLACAPSHADWVQSCISIC